MHSYLTFVAGADVVSSKIKTRKCGTEVLEGFDWSLCSAHISLALPSFPDTNNLAHDLKQVEVQLLSRHSSQNLHYYATDLTPVCVGIFLVLLRLLCCEWSKRKRCRVLNFWLCFFLSVHCFSFCLQYFQLGTYDA